MYGQNAKVKKKWYDTSVWRYLLLASKCNDSGNIAATSVQLQKLLAAAA